VNDAIVLRRMAPHAATAHDESPHAAPLNANPHSSQVLRRPEHFSFKGLFPTGSTTCLGDEFDSFPLSVNKGANYFLNDGVPLITT